MQLCSSLASGPRTKRQQYCTSWLHGSTPATHLTHLTLLSPCRNHQILLQHPKRHPQAASAGPCSALLSDASARRPGRLPAGPATLLPCLAAVRLPCQHRHCQGAIGRRPIRHQSQNPGAAVGWREDGGACNTQPAPPCPCGIEPGPGEPRCCCCF